MDVGGLPCAMVLLHGGRGGRGGRPDRRPATDVGKTARYTGIPVPVVGGRLLFKALGASTPSHTDGRCQLPRFLKTDGRRAGPS